MNEMFNIKKNNVYLEREREKKLNESKNKLIINL